MSKSQRTDSAQGAVNSMQSALTEIKPPEHCFMAPEHMPFWRSIMKARDAKLWTEADLENAANLARCKESIERLSRELKMEGDVIRNQRGTPIANPKHSILEQLSRRAMALSAKLHVHAEATSGPSRDEKPKNAAAKKAAQHMADLEDDDLIARPSH